MSCTHKLANDRPHDELYHTSNNNIIIVICMIFMCEISHEYFFSISLALYAWMHKNSKANKNIM